MNQNESMCIDDGVAEKIIEDFELIGELKDTINTIYKHLDYLFETYVGDYPISYVDYEIVDKPSGELHEGGKWIEYLKKDPENPWLEEGFCYLKLEDGGYLKLKF